MRVVMSSVGRSLGIALLLASCSTPQGHNDGGDVMAPTDTLNVDANSTDSLSGSDAVDHPDVALCHSDLDCTDGVFCNGAERCMPGASGASATGCLAASPANPCGAGQSCDEAMQRCITMCDTGADQDHDGHRAMNCGGDDCDDNDANRFPGNQEVCAWDGTNRVTPTHDEDCDPTTFANAATHDGDVDGDGYVDHACCNVDRSGMQLCGSDCRDTAPDMGVPATFMTTVQPQFIHPTQAEVCNGVDDNCNGMVDEGLPSVVYHRDCDGDGYGDASDPGMMGCIASEFASCMGHAPVADGSDCDDAHAAVHPGVTESCNGVDDNCNAMVDDSVPGIGSSCATGMLGVCSTGTQHCTSGALACPPNTSSTAEVCDGLDNNCNGQVDEGVTINCFRDADGDGFGVTTTVMPACTCPAGWVATAGDCDDMDNRAFPGQTMYFGTPSMGTSGYDFNCDGATNRRVTDASGTGIAACGPSCTAMFWLGASPPACGSTGTFETCRVDPTLGCQAAGVSRAVTCH